MFYAKVFLRYNISTEKKNLEGELFFRYFYYFFQIWIIYL